MPFVLHRKLPRALSFLHNMGHQAEVAFHQDIAGLHVPLGGEGQVAAFFFLGQRFGKAAGGQLQRLEQTAEHQPCG